MLVHNRLRTAGFGVGLVASIGLFACTPPGGPLPPDDVTSPPSGVTPLPSDPAQTPGALSGPFQPVINREITPGSSDLSAENGSVQPISAARDAQGVQSEFLEGLVLLKPRSDADLQDFLARYNGAVIRDNTIPPPPPELGITLTDAQRRPTEFVVRIDLASVDVSSLLVDGAAADLSGVLEFSSQAAMQTFAAVFDAKAAGFRAHVDYVYEGHQAFPNTLFRTSERPVLPATVPPTFVDPFTATASADFGTGGSQSNVTLAWQFIAAHGIERRVTVAIIDGGYWLDTAGRARGADSDFVPAPAQHPQYDFSGDDPIADGPNPGSCGPANPCYWHGTGSAGVATGIANNQLGAIGTGAQVADPFLFRFDGSKDQRNRAIRTAVAWGADVVSMSFGGDCNQACRVDDRDDNPFDDAVGSGSRTVFVASAGNGRGTPAVGYDVADPSFVHPCIEDNVLCVGALNPGANTKIGYSNFGGQVEIFAPTNIPVMSYPNSFFFLPCPALPCPAPIAMTPAQSLAAPEQPQIFTGTSASAPFVAGVVAMMKAVNPALGQREIEQILMETAGSGVAPVTRTINAFAAVERAAGAFSIVRDLAENNDLETIPTDLGSAPTYNRVNFNVDARDRDYFRFQSPGGSMMTVSLQYPQGLGQVSIFDIEGPDGACERPVYITDTALAGGGRSYVYRVPGGTLRLGLAADDVNAYNLGISFVTANYPPDAYEANDQVAAARRLQSFRRVGAAASTFLAPEPRVSIEATIHAAGDVDYYVVRGATATLAEQIFFVAVPRIAVSGNDSLINLEVFRLNANNTQGALVERVSGGACAAASLSVRLDSDAYYLVRVDGGPGRYTLSNGIRGEERLIPSLGRDRVYEVLHPLDPIEHVLRFPELYVLVADQAFNAVRATGLGLQMRLFDFQGALVAEAQPNSGGLRLDLSSTVHNQVYALELIPLLQDGAAPPLVRLEWDAEAPAAVTGNLIRNPGAETVFGESDIPQWEVPAGLGTPRLFFYDAQPGNPAPDGPGPMDRGMHLFAGGNSPFSGLRQSLEVTPGLSAVINEGRQRFSFSAFLGGNGAQSDHATATLVFRNANQQVLGQVRLSPVTVLERGGQTGLFPVEANGYVPPNTAFMVIDLTFQGGDGEFNDAYADNIQLMLSEFAR